MMKLAKRAAALLCAVLLLCGLMGCGSGSGGGNAGESVTNESGFPIAKDGEKIRLRVLTTKQPTQMDYDKMPFTSYYQDLTGVEIEWELAGWGAEATQKIQLDYMSDNAPDVVSVTNKFFTDAMIEQYSKEGKIADLDGYLEKWAPNIKALMDLAPESYDMCRNSEGKLTSLPKIVLGENHMRYGSKCYIRKTWLDALGLDMPRTTEEFYNVLKAFKQQDPNGNGIADEIPFVFQLLQAEVFASFGINYNGLSYDMMIDQTTGKFVYAPATDNMRDAIKFYSRLYNENLLSQKVIGEPGRYETTIKSGNVGVFFALANFTVCDYDLAREYVILPPLDSGKYPSNCYYSGFDTVTPNNLVISSSCKNIAAALRWFDYFYTAQGYKLLGEGVPGPDGIYRLGEDGKLTYQRDANESDSGTTPGGQIAYGYAESFEDWYIYPDMDDDSKLTELQVFNKYLPKSCTDAYHDYIPKYELKYPRATEKLAALMDDYATPMNDYANQMLISFLVGAKNIDSEWGTYITELKRLNMDQIVSEYQAAYDATYSK